MANRVRGGKILRKRRGGGGWGRGRAVRTRRWSGSDGTSDEDYVVAQEEVEDEGSSYCSYTSDASREDAGGDAESTSCAEEEEDEDEEYDASEYEESEVARGKRPRKRPAPAARRRKPEGKPSRRRKSSVPRIVEEVEAPLMRKPRAGSRRISRITDEGEEVEYDDDEDEEFTPDDDDGDEEYLASSPVRKAGGRRDGAVKRKKRRKKSGTRVSKEKNKKNKAPVKKKRKRKAPSSDDEEFIVDDAVLVEGKNRKNKRSSGGWKRRAKRPKTSPVSDDDVFVVEDGVLVERTKGKKRKKKIVSKGKKKRPRVKRSETSDSDFDYTISEEELSDLQVGGPLNRREQKTMRSAAQDEKEGRGKEVDDVGKQACGICLSEEQKGTIRGLLDCCAHYFCFACIMEWSKVESRCPLCKQRFKTISQSARCGSGCSGLSLRTVVKRIPKRDQVYKPSEEEMRNYLDPYADVVCMECQRGGDDHLMLLCDTCDSPAHTYCVGLARQVPDGNWYCDGCRSMDLGTSNPCVQDSAVEHGTRNSELLDTCGETVSMDTTNCRAPETPGRSATLPSPHESLSGVGRDGSCGSHSSVRDHVTLLPASGFAASTLSGRRSIRQHIQIMLSGNSRLTPEEVARDAVSQPSRVESDICTSEVDQHGETLHLQKESPENGRIGSSSRLFSTPRACMRPCMHNEATSFGTSEGAKGQVQSMVKNRMKRLTRNNPLERRVFKDIARRATHTILAACGAPHRRDIVTMPVEPPPTCVHPADGELSGLIKECCSVCFSSFVGSIVRRLVELNLQST